MLGMLVDEKSGARYLADTGSVYSLVPFSSKEPPAGPRLVTADKTPISCWGWTRRMLFVGGREVKFNFLKAAVAFPIVGADFLATHHLVRDLSGMRLSLVAGRFHVPLVVPPGSGTFAAVGIQQAPGNSSKSVAKRATTGDLNKGRPLVANQACQVVTIQREFPPLGGPKK